jgi:peroxiredoxin
VEQFVKLQEAVKAGQLGKVTMLAISPDPVDKLADLSARVAKKTGAPMTGVTLLSDADHKVIEQWGLLNEEAAARGRYLPHPATFVLDSAGVVRWRFIEKDYKIRPSNAMILEAIRAVK